jgi:hypothetical protein
VSIALHHLLVHSYGFLRLRFRCRPLLRFVSIQNKIVPVNFFQKSKYFLTDAFPVDAALFLAYTEKIQNYRQTKEQTHGAKRILRSD